MNEYRFNGSSYVPEIKTPSVPASGRGKKSYFAAFVITALVCVCAVITLIILVASGSGIHRKPLYIYTNPVTDERDKTGFSDITGGSGEAMSVSQIYKAVSPSVVGIVTQVPVSGLFGSSIGEGSGSGVIIRSDGYIMTNSHVIENAKEITVVLPDKREYPAVVVGDDEKTDLAVIKINENDLPAAVLGNSDTVEPGELAVAIGNPLGQELASSVTAGVVSAVNRNITVQGKKLNLIQTDAAINPGNSGGALANCFGEVIGINTVKMSSTSIEGIGFAIPISEALPIVNSLVDNGRVVGRTYIGITGENAPYGVIVRTVTENSPAAKAGIEVDDLIVKANGQTISSVQEINDIKEDLKVGDSITLTIYKDGELRDINIILEEAQ